MTLPPDTIQIYETPQFMEVAEHELSVRENEALKHFLAYHPYIGTPVEEYPSLFSFVFGDDKQHQLIYIYVVDKKMLLLIMLLDNGMTLPSPNSEEGKKFQNILRVIAKYGIGASLKCIWDWMKELLH